MALSDKNRKIVWGKSGNRCAICKKEIVMESTSVDSESVVGDECHIVSKSINGPRYQENYPDGEHDLPKNIILLCKVHHKQIDDQLETFTEYLLLKVKKDHEQWVNDKLSETDEVQPVKIRRVKENIPNHLQRITTGKDLLALALNTYDGAYDYEDLDTDELVHLVSVFFQNIQDWVDLGIDDISQRIQLGQSLTRDIKELDENGLWLFGAREQQILEGGIEPKSNWPVLHLQIISKNNKSIINVEQQKSS